MTSKKLTIIHGIIINTETTLSLSEICRATHTSPDLMMQFIEYHIISPIGSSENEWQFDHLCLKRAKLAGNFYRDLEINLPGIAVLLDMLEKIEYLETELSRFKKNENKF